MRLYHDRLELLLGATFLMTLPRGRAPTDGRRGYVVNYRHPIHSLRRKPMALLNLVYRDQLFPRPRLPPLLRGPARSHRSAHRLPLHRRLCWRWRTTAPVRQPWRPTWRICSTAARSPDLELLHQRFTPDPAALPEIRVRQPPLTDYNELLVDPRPNVGVEVGAV